MSDIAGNTQPGFLRMPKLPVAGFFRRFFAFLLDLFVVIGAIHFASRGIPDVFWALGEWSPYVTSIFVLLYFVLLNGPVGKGRTLGKMLLGIRVTDYRGNFPTWQQALARTVILLPGFVTYPLVRLFLGQADSMVEEYVKSLLTDFPMVCILVAVALTIPFNPFKQGIHDFFGKTLVRPVPTDSDEEAMTFDEMTEKVGQSWTKFHRQPQYSGGVTFGLLFILFAYMAWPGHRPDLERQIIENTYEMERIQGFQEADFHMIPMEDEIFQQTYLAQEEFITREVQTQYDPTTTPLTLKLPVLQHAGWPKDPLMEDFWPQAKIALNQYHGTILPLVIQLREESPDPRTVGKSEEWRTRPVELQLLFVSYVRLTPYPAPQMKIVGAVGKTFPPLKEN